MNQSARSATAMKMQVLDDDGEVLMEREITANDYGPDFLHTEEVIDRVLTRTQEAIDSDDTEAYVNDLLVDMGFWSGSLAPGEWLRVADAIYNEFEITDEEYNDALSRVLKPGEDTPGEPASAVGNPASTAALELAGELVYPAADAEPIR